MKEKIYGFLVRKNGRVWYEYERYVRENTKNGKRNRLKGYWVLLRLNWFYRVRKKQIPFLYWDVPIDPQLNPDLYLNRELKNDINEEKTTEKKKNIGNPWKYPEIAIKRRPSVEEFVQRLERYDIISFDVFDTLIFRYVSNPTDVFSIVGNQLGIYDYKNSRVEAEKCARQKTDNVYGEITLSEIYDILENNIGIDKTKAMELELSVEEKVCFANPYMLEVVKELVRKGKRLIATSNMYMDSIQIKHLLDICGYKDIKEVFSSCEFGVSKNKGLLQNEVWSVVGRSYSVIHVGDNYLADYIGSRIIGWKAFYYENVNEIGRNYRPAKMSSLLFSVYSGIVNSHFHNGINNEENMYYELGFGYLGLLVVGYCKWINEFAKKNKLTKLLFSSRDMCLVYEMYKKYFQEVDCDYIKISRFASIRFSYKRFSGYFIDSHIKARALIAKITIGEVLKELNIEFMADYLPDYKLCVDEIFSMKNFDSLKECLNDNKQIMLNNFEAERIASTEYYKQFVKKGDRVGIVDLGWQGTNAQCLKYLLEEMNMDLTVKSLLMVSYGTRDFVSNAFTDEMVDAYCFSPRKNEQLLAQFSPTKMGRFICELIFSSNEKSLKMISKNKEGDFVFSYIENEKRNEKEIEDIYRGARDFVEIWVQSKVYMNKIEGFDAILPLNKLSYSDICYEIMEGNEINPWIGETKAEAASNIRKIVR
ncbi:hypothetical protein [Butyrivibrio sp. MB2005]|uniref:hypothetical protein n=1 Tax=Butyrivibrio sp. MB2005 TaxID=1280678 RepID=UPI000428ECCB|nr:hypothetical protein [Butyrivibrio sp. MB2005]